MHANAKEEEEDKDCVCVEWRKLLLPSMHTNSDCKVHMLVSSEC